MKSKISKNNKYLKFYRNDFSGVFNGIDLAIHFSFIPFLSYYFLPNFDSRLSIVLMSSIICLSLFVRVFSPLFIKMISNPKIGKKNILIILMLSYILPLIFPNEDSFLNINLILLIISRVIIGFILSLNDNLFREIYEDNFSKFSNIKHFLLLSFGVCIGLFVSSILNQLFSNFQLNNGSWKVGNIILVLIFLIFSYLFNIRRKFKDLVINEDNFLSDFNKSFVFGYSLKYLFILLAYSFLFLFCLTSWLPGSVLSENMSVSQIQLIHIIFFILSSIFSNFIFQLIGKEKVFNYFIFFSLIVTITLFFFNSRESSYSINFLHFFIAVISSFSISLFLNELGTLKKYKTINFYLSINIPLFLISLLIPFLVYYLMFNVIIFNHIYLIISSIMILSLIGKIVIEKIN